MNYKQAAEQLREYSKIFYEERKRRGCLTWREHIDELSKEFDRFCHGIYEFGTHQEKTVMDGMFKKLSQKVDN